MPKNKSTNHLLNVVYPAIRNTTISLQWCIASWNFYIYYPTNINTFLSE